MVRLTFIALTLASALVIFQPGCGGDGAAGPNTGGAGAGGSSASAGTQGGAAGTGSTGQAGTTGAAGNQGGTAGTGSAGTAAAGSSGGASAAGSSGTGAAGTTGGAGGVGGTAGAGAGGAAGSDTWDSYATSFFTSFCVSCHNDDKAGAATRDYHVMANVVKEKVEIACGVAKSQAVWTARGCTGFPPARQFPVGGGAKPTDAERDRLLKWIDAGTP